MSVGSVTARQILYLLEAKHSQDVGVSECKIGSSTMMRNCLRFDYWAMPRSWAKPWVSGYEIKVSRADFMGDTKWPGYLPYCNLFSFVCPWGLIAPEEVPDGVGLFWATKTLGRLMCKRKPALRSDVEIPDSIFRYVLMSRAKITGARAFAEDEITREQLQDYLERQSETNRAVDRAFKAAVHKAVMRRVGEVVEENTRLRKEQERIEQENGPLRRLHSALEEAGIQLDRWGDPVERLQRHFGLSSYQKRNLQDLHRNIGKTLELLGVQQNELG